MKRKLMPLLLVIVVLLCTAPAHAATVTGFSDVHESDYYADAVEWAEETGVTNGTGNGKFSPAASVTRADAMTMFWRAAGKPEPTSSVSPFTDVTDANAYYYKAVLWAVEQGITGGIGNNQFGRSYPVAYDQILAFLCRASGQEAGGSGWSAAAISWAKQNGLTDGLSFTATGSCPRSDVVYFLWKQLAEQQTMETPISLSDEDGAKAAIINGFLEQSGQIAVSSYNIESSVLLKLAEEIADQDGKNPYNITTFTCTQEKGQCALFLQVSYLTQGSSSALETSEEIRTLAENVVKDVITPGMSDYETAKALHDWLVLNCKYDTRLYSGNMPHDSYTAYGPLKCGTSVCAGYAKAYLALLEAAGMEAEYVTGDTTRGYHARNIVKVDGAWYHVDTTWDDPTPDKEGYVRYNYFLRSDAFMSKDHSNWNAGHACTSTKYDGTTLPNTTEQARLEAEKAEQERLEKVADEVLSLCLKALDQFPYTTTAQLQAAETLTSDDAYPVITLPKGQYSASDLSKIREQLKAGIAVKYPNYQLMIVNSTSITIKRSDVVQELQRRYALQKEEEARQEQAKQAEADARIAGIEALLQEAIRNGNAAHYTFTVPGDYTYGEIQQACQKMNTSDYRFGDYTSKDYKVNPQPFDKVSIFNYKWQAEEELRQEQARQEEQARLAALPAAIAEYCYEAMADFPTIEELQSVTQLTSQHSYPVIRLPSDLCNSAALAQAKTLLEAGISEQYPDYEVYSVAGWGIVIQRNDVLAEMERRNAALLETQQEQQTETVPPGSDPKPAPNADN